MSNKKVLNKYKKVSINNRNKKKGFTLIELIAVMAIIAILATAIIPRVTGYVKEAKKTKVIDQCRKVIMAVESYNVKQNSNLVNTTTIMVAKDTKGISKYLVGVNLVNLNDNTTVQDCYDILNGAEFDIEKDTEKLKVGSIEKLKTASTEKVNIGNIETKQESSQ
ncbi:type II secretion system protein [Clostridium uliginosum]|uniref:Type IV pilus assembly protein PilA n=1 Tax=Clostridium uliginosum TaxID=119641 RepID=A0A1I1J588_9CLOT|nr:type IV pilus assembly protein PilA [Clostridium uliginosum]